MKNFAFSLLLLTSVNLSSQITIDNSHMPSNGDSLRFSLSILDTALVSNYQIAGSNLAWNYDSLVPIRQGISEYIASSQSPYNVTNRIAEKLADTIDLAGTDVYDLFNFYSSDTSSFSITDRGATVPTGLGFPFPSTLKVVQSSIDKDEVYQFPLDYLDRDSSNYDLEYTSTFPSAYVGSSGYRINDVDAWGSLTTPFGTFNCIRVVTDIVGYDTVDAGSNTTGINSHQREYKWLTTQFEIPALTIIGTVDSGIFVPSAIQYRDSVRNVPSLFVPIPQFSTNDTVVGIGDTVTLSNSSISLLSTNYQWEIQPATFQYINGTSATSGSIIIIINDTGSYDVKLIATNSSGSDSLLREDYIRVDIPIPLFTADDTLVRIGDTVNFSNSSISFLSTSYQWDIQPTNFQYINGTSAITDSITVIFNDTGYYDVKLIATSSGGSDSLLKEDYIRVDILVGLEEGNRQASSFNMFPNPTKKGAIISISTEIEDDIEVVRIYDMNGRLLQQKIASQQEKQFQLKVPENKGIYIIQLETKSGQVNERLVVE